MLVQKIGVNLKILEKIVSFHLIDDKSKDRLLSFGQIIVLKNKRGDQQDYQLGNKMYLLVEGRSFLTLIAPEGKKIILETLEPGDFFGTIEDPYDFKSDLVTEFIEPLPKSETVICEFSKEKFIQLLSEDPHFAQYVTLNLFKRVSKLEKKIEELTLYTVESRVLKELTRLGHQEDSQNVKVDSKVTHETLAQSTGLVRETVTKAIKKLKKVGVLSYDKNKNLIVRLMD